ncbi:probable tRNA(His) guanylyltransferase [Galendromus occidentalis]|uniref:tRNA(His) guanylyltransferase n=1 Tax=Galendromus occidentalis TaxID=34638 RepID=A0AAJ6QNT5_9ACAR|nr:probable tRNA(His) guanylyltransferase [Galendromus occidentalis]
MRMVNAFWVVDSTFRRALFCTTGSMAKSKFDYVRNFEHIDSVLPNTYIVVRLDGKGFHKFTQTHNFKKPNDSRGLNLMSRCAESVMDEFSEIAIAYGQSDEYSFVFRKSAEVYKRRASKLMTNIASLFASSYVFYFSEFFPEKNMTYPPAFDARVVLYPSDENLRDYLSWRQADCHINNLYNTAFWALVQEGGLTPTQAEKRLRGTVSSEKNEILFKEFQRNYNNEDALFRKGTCIIRVPKEINEVEGTTVSPLMRKLKPTSTELRKLNCDMIQKDFWDRYPFILQ